MAEQTRGSRMAIVEESSEGALTKPSAGTDYIALQDGFSLAPEFEVLTNEEIKASIGKSKDILGQENPTAEIAHYLKHSGVEAQPPEDDLLIESAFGSRSVRATERDVVSSTAGDSSSASTITVDVGEGVEFAKGDVLLIKHAASAWEMRPVHEVSGDILTLGFNVNNAPGASTNLGRNVKYAPVDSGHPTLSLWDYRGNKSAVQAMSGARVSEMSFSASPNELTNASYSLNGLEFFFNPVEITATDVTLDFSDSLSASYAATISADIYKDPYEVASALQTAMNAVGAADTYTVSYSDSSGKFTIASDSTPFELLHNTGANAANAIGDAIGFDTSADDTGAGSYEADDTIFSPAGSAGNGLVSPQTPSLDSSNPLVAKDNSVFIGDFNDNVCFSAQSIAFTLSDELTPVPDICATSGRSGQVINGREVSIDVVANLTQYEADKFHRFHTNQDTRFLFNFGTKAGGNWEAGKSGSLYIPQATITSFALGDADGIVTMEMTLTAFVGSDGSGEVFLNFL